MEASEEIEKAFREAGIAGLPVKAFDQFHDYLELLLRWNLRVNLTAVREPLQIIQRHFVECSLVAQHIPLDVRSLLDYGSGGGSSRDTNCDLSSWNPGDASRGAREKGCFFAGSSAGPGS